MEIAGQENRFLLIFALSVLSLTALTLTSVAAEDGPRVVMVTAEENSARTPAAISEKSLLKKAAKVVIQSIQWDLCKDEKISNEVQIRGEFVQMKGRNCDPKKFSSELKIVNETNGYTASIIPLGADGYQTDLIQLNEGKNQILIRYQSLDGESFEKKIELQSKKNKI